MARASKAQASDDLWHLSIDDLFASAAQEASGPVTGPFVINLSLSSAPSGAMPRGMPRFERLCVYQLKSAAEDREEFRLRLGIIQTELEADAILAAVREHYPAARKETASAEDSAAVVIRAQRAAQRAAQIKKAAAKPPVPVKPSAPAPPARDVMLAKPQVSQPPGPRGPPPPWNLDEVLPQFAAMAPLVVTPEPKPSAPKQKPAAPKRSRPAHAPARRAPHVEASAPAAAAARAEPAITTAPAATVAPAETRAAVATTEPLPEAVASLTAVATAAPTATSTSEAEPHVEAITIEVGAPETSGIIEMELAAPPMPVASAHDGLDSDPDAITKEVEAPTFTMDAPVFDHAPAPSAEIEITVEALHVPDETTVEVRHVEPELTFEASEPDAETTIEAWQPDVERTIEAPHADDETTVEARQVDTEPTIEASQVEEELTVEAPRIEVGQAPRKREIDTITMEVLTLNARLDIELQPADAPAPVAEFELTLSEPAADAVLEAPPAAIPSPRLEPTPSPTASAAPAPAPIAVQWPMSQVARPDPVTPTPPVRAAKASAPVKAAAPAPAAPRSTRPAKSAAPPARSPEDSGSLERLVAKIDAMVEELPTPTAGPSISIDSTQTQRALTSLDVPENDPSPHFVVQLILSEDEIDPEHVPSLDIFSEYRLYRVTGLDQERVMHALRLGFFSSEPAAQAVAGYLAVYFDTPTIKRVSVAERERFAEDRVKPRKDVGATGTHSVIELTSPTPLPERRAREISVDQAADGHAKGSIWSRLVKPLKR